MEGIGQHLPEDACSKGGKFLKELVQRFEN